MMEILQSVGRVRLIVGMLWMILKKKRMLESLGMQTGILNFLAKKRLVKEKFGALLSGRGQKGLCQATKGRKGRWLVP